MKSLLLFIILVLNIALVSSNKKDDNVCQSVKTCFCRLSASSYVDLTPIGNKIFSVKDGLIPTKYEIELCNIFTNKKCKNVLGCREGPFQSYSIGNVFNFTSTSLYELQNGDGGRLTKITLDCDTSSDSTLKFDNESPKNTFNFKLTSPHACVKTDTTTTSTEPTNVTTATTHPTNATTATTHPTNATTATTHPTNATTATTLPTNATTATTHPTNATTATTHPTNATTATTHPTNATTATTHPTVPTNSTTAATSPSTISTVTTHPTTTAPPSTTHKGGASNIISFNAISLLITGLVMNKVFW